MAFTDKEISNDQGIRIGLYHFRRGSQNWYYTSADRAIVYGVDGLGAPITYEPIAVSDGGVVLGGDGGYEFEVTLPSTNEVALLFRVTPPSGRVYLKVRRMQQGEADAPLYWSGSVGNARPSSLAGTVLVCRSAVSRLQGSGNRFTFQRQCPHALYGRGCNVPIEDWQYPYVVASKVGNVITLVTAGVGLDQAAGFFSGGIMQWLVATDTYDLRMIEVHTSPLVFTIFGRGDGITPGQSLLLSPGCTRDISPTGCERFDNVDNYGGHLYMPGKSPFDGDPVF